MPHDFRKLELKVGEDKAEQPQNLRMEELSNSLLSEGTQYRSATLNSEQTQNLLPSIDLVISESNRKTINGKEVPGEYPCASKEQPFDEQKAIENLQHVWKTFIEHFSDIAKELGLRGKEGIDFVSQREKACAPAEQVAEMLIKGDLEGLKKMMMRKDGTPVDIEMVAELLRKSGLDIRVELKNGDLRISHPGDHVAISISPNGETKLMSLQQIDSHWVYKKEEFCDENPKQELQDILRKAQEKKHKPVVELPDFGWDRPVQIIHTWPEDRAKRRPWSNSDAMLHTPELIEKPSMQGAGQPATDRARR